MSFPHKNHDAKPQRPQPKSDFSGKATYRELTGKATTAKRTTDFS